MLAHDTTGRSQSAFCPSQIDVPRGIVTTWAYLAVQQQQQLLQQQQQVDVQSTNRIFLVWSAFFIAFHSNSHVGICHNGFSQI
jgi:hypothetical protein